MSSNRRAPFAFAAVVVSVVAVIGAIDLAWPQAAIPTGLQPDLSYVQPFPSPIANQTTLPNGTEIKKFAYPILVVSPGSTVEIWAKYAGGSYSGPAYSSAFTWAAGQPAPGLNVSASPPEVSISMGQTAVVKYTLDARQNSTGFYGLHLLQLCERIPVAVAYDSSQINSSDFPGAFGFTSCPAISLQVGFLGVTGAKVVFLTTESRVIFRVNITDKSVSSFPTTGEGENVTFRMRIHSFSRPVTVGLSLNQSFVREFVGNPDLTADPASQACYWVITSVADHTEMKTSLFQNLPSGYLEFEAPVLHLGPYSTARYSFSILVPGPIAKDLAMDPILYVDAPNPAGFGMATFFPLSVSGHLQTISGPCDSQEG